MIKTEEARYSRVLTRLEVMSVKVVELLLRCGSGRWI